MPRLQLTRAFGALALLLAAVTSPTSAQSAEFYERMARQWQSRVVAISGRIVDNEGQPIEGAQVDLMSHDTPHRAPYILATSVTRADGRFGLPRRRAFSFERLVVSALGAQRSYRLSVYVDATIIDEGQAEIRLGDLPVGASRELLVTAECATDVPSDASSSIGIWITIEWRGHGLVRQQIMPEGLSFLDPSGDVGARYRLRWSPAERRFQRRFLVPPGTHDIHLTGDCGEALARAAVPAAGPVTRVHASLGSPR